MCFAVNLAIAKTFEAFQATANATAAVASISTETSSTAGSGTATNPSASAVTTNTPNGAGQRQLCRGEKGAFLGFPPIKQIFDRPGSESGLFFSVELD